MTFHRGQAAVIRNTPQAYSQWVTPIKWVSPRAFQGIEGKFFLQFIDDCLDWVEEHKKQSAMPATVRRNNTMHSRDGPI